MTFKNKSGDGKETSGQTSETSDAITRKLRSYYASVQDQGIPERFLDLLEKLDEAEKKQSRGQK